MNELQVTGVATRAYPDPLACAPEPEAEDAMAAFAAALACCRVFCKVKFDSVNLRSRVGCTHSSQLYKALVSEHGATAKPLDSRLLPALVVHEEMRAKLAVLCVGFIPMFRL